MPAPYGNDEWLLLPSGSYLFVQITADGVTVTKAATKGGSQSALTFPMTRDEAVELAVAMYRVLT